LIESELGVEETVGSDLKRRKENAEGRWSEDEHQRFLEAHKLYRKDWKKIEKHIGTRSAAQARSHAQKYFRRLNRIKNIERTNEATASSSPLSKPIKGKTDAEKPLGAKTKKRTKRILNYDEGDIARKHVSELLGIENQVTEEQNGLMEAIIFPQVSLIMNMQYDPYAAWERELDIENFKKRIDSYRNGEELESQNANENEEECIGLQGFRRSRTLSSMFE